MDQPATAPLAVLTGAGRTYGSGENAVHALRDVDLELGHGELVVVLGPSGSGKTTLLNLLGGIEQATAGRVEVAGYDLGATKAHQLTEIRRDVIGFVFQFFNLIATLTARENVSVLAELTGHARDGRVEEVLAEVELTDRADHFPAQLSGGQQQRVAIARALVKSPALLLCDEPTGALDLETGRTVLDLLQRVAREQHRTVVIVTHNRAIAAMADRVVHMRSGRITEDTVVAEPLPAAEVVW
ncbi:MAG: ABC transporter ATP-binding protein [Kineosporiaceae bacterium]|jgi:putative ABC transport system ATP-binding protein